MTNNWSRRESDKKTRNKNRGKTFNISTASTKICAQGQPLVKALETLVGGPEAT